MIEAGHEGSPKVQSTQVLLVLLHAIMEALLTWEMALCFSTGLYGLGRVLGGEIDLNPCVKGFCCCQNNHQIRNHKIQKLLKPQGE